MRIRLLSNLVDVGAMLEQLKSIVSRVVPVLHLVELRHRACGQPRAAAYHVGKKTRKKGGGKSRDAMAAEVESDEPDDLMPEADDRKTDAPDDIQDVVRDELESLVAECHGLFAGGRRGP